MSKPIDFDSLKSLKEATPDQIAAVMGRYERGGAAGTTPTGEAFLKQQSMSTQVVQCDLTEKEIRGLCEQREIPWNDQYAGRVKRFAASDESVDSYGDIIRQNGWDFSRYEKNPVIMWAHDYSQLNIGSGLSWKVSKKVLTIDVLFALPETYSFADMIFRMVDAGFLKGNSVGFYPKKVMYVEDEKEREALGLGRWGVVFLEQLLLENSICPIGANPNALVQDALVPAMQRGLIKADELRGMLRGAGPEDVPTGILETVDRALTLLSSGLVSVGKEAPPPPAPEAKEEPETPPAPLAAPRFMTEEEWKEALAGMRKAWEESIRPFDTKLLEIENTLAEIRGALDTDNTGAGGASPKPDHKSDLYGDLFSVGKEIISNLSKKG